MDIMQTPIVHVVIVSYNGRHNLEYALPSLVNQDYSNFKIFVADNNSNDGTKEWLSLNFPQVKLIEQSKNIGMAAMNDVLSWPKENGVDEVADYIFVAGWDLVFDRRCISHAVEAMNENKGLGVIGFEVLGLFEWVDLSELEKRSSQWIETKITDVTWVPGACSFYRGELIRQIGFLDPVYFIYAEEDDMQFRIRACRFRTAIINTPCWQNVRESAIPLKISSYLFFRNSIRYHIKNTNLRFGIRVALSLLFTACSPFHKLDLNIRVNQRKRPYGVLKNFTIWLKAFSWNILNISETLESSNTAKQKVILGKILFNTLNPK